MRPSVHVCVHMHMLTLTYRGGALEFNRVKLGKDRKGHLVITSLGDSEGEAESFGKLGGGDCVSGTQG